MELNFMETKTKSGVTLWTLSSTNFNSVAVGVIVKCGTRDEIWPKEAGIAHALEHMHFQGTMEFPNNMKLTGYIEEVGGRINAFTNNERTFYFVRVPSNYAERGVHIINEQLTNAIIPENKIQTEMKNVVQEIKRRNDNPQQYLGLLSKEFIYGDHPLGRDVLGFEDSVSSFTKEDFLAFKNRYYNFSNYIFVAIGNITENEAVKLFDKYFKKDLENRPSARKKEGVVIKTDKQLIKNKELDQLHISLDALIGKGNEKESLFLEFFRDMISGGMSFPLFQEVRDKRGLCYTIWASITKRTDIGNFSVYVGTNPKQYKEAINATIDVIEKSKSDINLLNKVKNLKLGKLMLGYENTEDIIMRATNDILFLGRPRGFEEIKKEIEEVKIEDIETAVNKYLKPELIYTTMLAPKDFKAD